MASRLHQIFTGLGVVLGLIAAFFSKSLTLGLIFILVPGLLWFYSASYKRQFLIGNLIIAFCAALVPLVVLLPDSSLFSQRWSEADLSLLIGNHEDFLLWNAVVIRTLYKWTCSFALFAFLVTFIREVVKDMEDEYGDRELECRTMPVVLGFVKTKIFLYILTLATMGLLSYGLLSCVNFPGARDAQDMLSARYLIFGILLPFLYFIYLIFKAKVPTDYHQASGFVKFIMILGMLYSVILYFLLAINYNIKVFGIFQYSN